MNIVIRKAKVENAHANAYAIVTILKEIVETPPVIFVRKQTN